MSTDVVYIVHGAEGTCPSDAHDWVEGVYANKADADAYAAKHTTKSLEPFNGGPWFEVKEHKVVPAAPPADRDQG
jgi:hypothetical protein